MEAVQQHLEKIKQGQPSSRELVFDEQSGQLVARNYIERVLNPDGTVVDQTVQDGFAWRVAA